jgi:hypothetical protein
MHAVTYVNKAGIARPGALGESRAPHPLPTPPQPPFPPRWISHLGSGDRRKGQDEGGHEDAREARHGLLVRVFGGTEVADRLLVDRIEEGKEMRGKWVWTGPREGTRKLLSS